MHGLNNDQEPKAPNMQSLSPSANTDHCLTSMLNSHMQSSIVQDPLTNGERITPWQQSSLARPRLYIAHITRREHPMRQPMQTMIRQPQVTRIDPLPNRGRTSIVLLRHRHKLTNRRPPLEPQKSKPPIIDPRSSRRFRSFPTIPPTITQHTYPSNRPAAFTRRLRKR